MPSGVSATLHGVSLKDPEARRAYNRAYYLANRDKWERAKRFGSATPAEQKRRREANPERERAKVRAFQEQKRGLVREAKGRPCVDCGGEFPHWVMDLDHVRGEKSFDIGKNAGLKKDAVMRAEIAKCDVVCANCHRERTEMRRRGGGA